MVSFEAASDTDAVVDSYYVDWFEIAYRHCLVARHGILKFRTTTGEGVLLRVKGFNDDEVMVFDITDLSLIHI